ncbi:Inward rectifier potassium channel family protein [Acanthocheilonema viteae]
MDDNDNHEALLNSSLIRNKICRPRLVTKDGRCALQQIGMPHLCRSIFRNWFHLVIECSWRIILCVFASAFIITWVIFALIYYLIVLPDQLLTRKQENEQCIANVYDLKTAFLFSLETQHTIGYGFRYVTDACLPLIFILSLQCIAGVFMQTMLSGIVVAKLLRPKKRKQELRFSQVAVIGSINDTDRRPALMIRIADIQNNLYIAEPHVRLYMATSKINKKGERELADFKDMNVGYDAGWDRILLLWPIIVRHLIDDQSPLFAMTPEKMHNAHFELIMTVEGIVEATGMTFQARTSFLPDEILWGYRFRSMVVLNEKIGRYEIHYKLFDEIEPIGKINLKKTEIDDSNDGHDSSQNISGFVW